MQEDRELNPPENTTEPYYCLLIKITYDFNNFSPNRGKADITIMNNLDFNIDDIRSWIIDTFDSEFTLEEIGDLESEGYLKVIYDGEETRCYFEEEELWN